jgi:hypothetical protein
MSKSKAKLSSPSAEPKSASDPYARAKWTALSLALAAFVAGSAAHANTPSDSSLGDRIAAAKDKLVKSQPSDANSLRLAQWLNVGIPAPWGNWHNWHNWNNWHWGWYNY